jgi:hypothetical protein
METGSWEEKEPSHQDALCSGYSSQDRGSWCILRAQPSFWGPFESAPLIVVCFNFLTSVAVGSDISGMCQLCASPQRDAMTLGAGGPHDLLLDSEVFAVCLSRPSLVAQAPAVSFPFLQLQLCSVAWRQTEGWRLT